MTASIDTLIDQLVLARRERRTLDAAPYADVLRHADDAYLVQTAVANELDWFGDAVAGHWKSGGPSRTATLGHSALPPQAIWPSPASVGDWPFGLRAIEAEVALRVGVDVDAERAATLDLDSASALVDAMTVAIELVDSRWTEGVSAPALLRLADLQSNSALVLGTWVPYERRDWSTQRCHVTLGTRGTTTHTGTHSLADPAWVLPQWLRHATADGGVVKAGTVVTTGTWCGVLVTQPGELVTVAFDGIGQASVQT